MDVLETDGSGGEQHWSRLVDRIHQAKRRERVFHACWHCLHKGTCPQTERIQDEQKTVVRELHR